MKKIVIVLSFFILMTASPIFGIGEKQLNIGAAAGWKAVVTRSAIAELESIRPYPVLALSSSNAPAPHTDLYLSFDEGHTAQFKDHTGNYTVASGSGIQTTARHWARQGAGAALFSGVETVSRQASIAEPLVIVPKNPSALFAPARNIGDFSIEFFLFPANMESGEEVFEWQATKRSLSGSRSGNQFQSIRAVVAKNRLHWSFNNFFSSPDSSTTKNITISTQTHQTPLVWTHHLIRFEAATGLLEYLVDGKLEYIVYTTATGREGGEVWTPIAGERGYFSIGRQFNGFIDELKISSAFEEAASGRYAEKGGRIETDLFDLGEIQSTICKVDINGGIAKLVTKPMKNEYYRGGDFKFKGGAQLQFFIRAADSRYAVYDADYTPFKSGETLYAVKGRFVQILVDFYPSGDLESTPYIDELKLEYLPKAAPKAPSRLSARAMDGAVELSWKATGDEIKGYLVYYGTKSGEYFGMEAGRGSSPIDAGNTTNLRLDNLKNGVLYYFAVVAYSDSGPLHAGDFSREVSARPLRMLE